jgi:hypothetical protein
MKTDTYDPKGAVEDDFWTERLQLLTAQFPTYYTKPQKVWGRFHTSEEDYFGAASEIVPLKHKKGRCTYIMMHPYVLEPILTFTVGLYKKPKQYADQETALGKTIGQPKQEGFREVQVGNAQAWYYPADKTIVLGECFFSEGFCRHPLSVTACKQWHPDLQTRDVLGSHSAPIDEPASLQSPPMSPH